MLIKCCTLIKFKSNTEQRRAGWKPERAYAEVMV